MSDSSSAGNGIPGLPGLGDLLGMFGTNNPLTTIAKTVEQFRRGVNEFLTAVENFNSTMQTLNGVATRVTALMDEVEEPIRALMPQVTRSIRATDTMINQISGPIEKVAPGIARLADTLSSPVFVALPNEIADFFDTIGDVRNRITPLAQMAETAGNLFGLRALNPFGGSPARPTSPSPPAPATTQATSAPPPAPKQATPKQATPKQATPKKAAPRKAATKKAPTKKAAAKKAPTKKAAAKKAPTSKAAATRG